MLYRIIQHLFWENFYEGTVAKVFQNGKLFRKLTPLSAPLLSFSKAHISLSHKSNYKKEKVSDLLL